MLIGCPRHLSAALAKEKPCALSLALCAGRHTPVPCKSMVCRVEYAISRTGRLCKVTARVKAEPTILAVKHSATSVRLEIDFAVGSGTVRRYCNGSLGSECQRDDHPSKGDQATTTNPSKDKHDKGAAAFKIADKDNDGTLDKEEPKAMPHVAKNFDAIDTDKDGTVSLKEIRILWKPGTKPLTTGPDDAWSGAGGWRACRVPQPANTGRSNASHAHELPRSTS
jgi:hypothetical protein